MVDISKQKVTGAGKRVNQAIDVSAEKLQRQIDRLFNRFFRSYSSLISGQKDIDLIKAARINEEARVLVQEAGLGEVLDAYLEEFPTLQRKSLRYFSEIGLDTDLNELNRTNLSLFANNAVIDLEATIDRRLLLPLEDALLDGVVGNLDDSQIVSSLMNVQDTFSSREVDNFFGDTYNSFNQMVSNAKAEELGMAIYSYAGPFDKVTSAPCRDILLGAPHGVPGLYLKEEIHNGMVPGITAPNVFINGTHFNCRHQWIPVTIQYARDIGADFPKTATKRIEKQEAL